MSEYELSYKKENDYYNKLELTIRLKSKPSKVDMDSILDAIETLEDFANKYLKSDTETSKKEVQ